MSHAVGSEAAFPGDSALSTGQLAAIRELVGKDIALEDLPALEAAYRDFRAGMAELKASFEQLTRTAEHEVTP
ncbi:hypothetical protein ACIQC5_11180 [Paenarthrobacter sp. NPDC092416]|uniref:hypothetical protein n=1 Tax=Paenarthrobacter sp. NPDC092416 TaxID=3364386 RepID=UPI00382954E4